MYWDNVLLCAYLVGSSSQIVLDWESIHYMLLRNEYLATENRVLRAHFDKASLSSPGPGPGNGEFHELLRAEESLPVVVALVLRHDELHR